MSWLVPSPSPTSRRRRGSGLASRARTTTAVVPVLAALAVCSLVVSCSGDGDGGAQATATATGSQAVASQTASPTPTPTASALPSLSAEDQALKDAALAMEKPEPSEGMNEYSAEGASLAAGYFIYLYPYVYATGDLTDWQAMSEEGCGFCNNVTMGVTEHHSTGGWDDPWEQQVTIISYGQVEDDPTTILIDVNIASGEIVTHDADGTVIARRAARDTELVTLQMHWNGESWNVAVVAMT